MTIKTLLFCIFLYVCLVWVVAAYLFTGDPAGLREMGLFWTGAGLLAVLVFIIAARIWGWWRLWRARTAARPRAAAAGKPAPVIHEDDTALAALLTEANTALAKAPGYRTSAGISPLSRLPLYLLIGPEGSGKTSTFLNSGLDPQLLAGQPNGGSATAPTRLCNLWLAKNAIFAELSGRLFSGDSERWLQLLGMLRGSRTLPAWRRLRGDPQEGLRLRGVVAFCDVREFSGASADPQRLERYCRLWQERLRGIGETFGVEFPVYTAISKSETIPFFPDFFRRLPEVDASEVLGCTLPWRDTNADAGEVFAEAEARRITASFRPLYHALAERRITQLAQEPVLARRPAIYEYPRELKRIRPPLVQFLTDAFRPNPLKPGARLRGYYFIGTRDVEAAAGVEAAGGRPDLASGDLGGTHLFRGFDATRLFAAEEANRPSGPAPGRGLVRRWMFVTELFHAIILRDAPLETTQPADPRIANYRRGILAAICATCLLLCFVFLGSWLGNRSLLNEVQAAGLAAAPKSSGPVTLADLQSLDQLRIQVTRLREGGGLSLHWGLYSGNEVLEPARSAYFARFRQLLLNDLNARIVRNLVELSAGSPREETYGPTYGALKTHLTISSGVCKLDAPLVGRVLKESRAQTAPNASPEWGSLADAQIDFYVAEFAYGNPCRLPEDVAARESARESLHKLKGLDQIYTTTLAGAEKGLPKPTRLGDLSPNYTQVLSGPSEPGAIFTQDGWSAIEKASKNVKGAAPGETCVTGEGVGPAWRPDTEIERGIQSRYLHDYVRQWRNYVAGFSINRYATADDAARKLDILSANNSPLLALLALTANRTSFPAPADGAITTVAKNVPVVGDWLKGSDKRTPKIPGTHADTAAELGSPADIARYFQPVHSVVGPQSQAWVTEKNKAYMEALAELGRSMREIARAGTTIDAAAHQAANQNLDKALVAAAQISRAFNPTGVEGLDQVVRTLLDRPIQLARPFIKTDTDAVTADKLNGQFKGVCASIAPMLGRYPLNQASKEDARLDEFTKAFAPNGVVLKFAQSLGELIVKEGSQWKAKDPGKKPQIRQDLLNYLNAVQRVADGLYPGGAPQPQLRYTLRPKLEGFGDTKLELEVDGEAQVWIRPIQHDFTWPPPWQEQGPRTLACDQAAPAMHFWRRPAFGPSSASWDTRNPVNFPRS